MTQLDRLIEEVDALGLDDKERLYVHLGQMLRESRDPGYDEAWEAEIARRLEDYESGRAEPQELRDVLTRLRERFGDR